MKQLKSCAVSSVFAVLAFVGSMALAQTQPASTDNSPAAAILPTPDSYACQLIMISPDLPDSPIAKFKAIGPQTTSHGGIEYKFTFGSNDFVIQANARWKGITWTKNKVLIANALTVMASDSQDSQVLMTTNPANPEEEYVTLECVPE